MAPNLRSDRIHADPARIDRLQIVDSTRHQFIVPATLPSGVTLLGHRKVVGAWSYIDEGVPFSFVDHRGA